MHRVVLVSVAVVVVAVCAVAKGLPKGLKEDKRWNDVKAQLDANPHFANLYFMVANADTSPAAPLFEHQVGSAVAATTPIPIMSGAKWVGAAAIMRAVQDGEGGLTLDSHPQDFLAFWTKDPTDPRSAIKLRHLLSFTSGLTGKSDTPDPSDPCNYDPATTLTDCVKTIHEHNNPPAYASGTGYDYSSNHLAVAAAMAVAATGSESWADFFKARIVDIIGIEATPDSMIYFPSHFIAGGLVIQPQQYASFLQAMFSNRKFLDEDSIASMDQDGTPEPDVEIHFSPYKLGGVAGHYASGHWIDCPLGTKTFDSSCTDLGLFSSTGLFGFSPWISRTREYYGLFAALDQQNPGADAKALASARAVQGLIEEILADYYKPHMKGFRPVDAYDDPNA